MPISIKNDQTELLARKLAELTGETLTEAVRAAVAERYDRLRRARSGCSLADELNAIASAARNARSCHSSAMMKSWVWKDATTSRESRRDDPEAMTLDTSAVLAILRDEAERIEFVALIEQAPRRLISAVSVLEAAMVLEGCKGDDAGSDLDLFLQRASIETVAFDMLSRSGPARLCCSRGRISRQPTLLARGPGELA
jgi:uncharacterized protein with PIN domain